MLYGVNLLLLGDSMTSEIMEEFPRMKEWGFDGVEVPVFEPESLPVDEVRKAAESAGLRLTCSGALPPGTCFYGNDINAHKGADRYLLGCVKVMQALGADLICGPLAKAVGDFDESIPLDAQREQTASRIRPCLDAASAAGVVFAFEPLNRFETNFLNTTAQGVEFCRMTGSPAATLLLDSFHMHIEEKDTFNAIQSAAAAGMFGHLHIAENDRGVAGSGQVHWESVAKAISTCEYDAWCVLESFSQTVSAIRRAVSCWRPFYADVESFCCRGLAFVKSRFGD